MPEQTAGIVSYISTGNIITIIIFIIGMIANIVISTQRLTKFITMTEMRFMAGDKKFIEHDKDIENLDKRCGTCPNAKAAKDKIDKLETERDRMNDEQIRLRAEWPVRISNIETDIKTIKDDIKLIKKAVQKNGHIEE